MSFTSLVLDGPVAVLSVGRPGGNRISFEMRRELREAVRQVAESGARALLIRGEGHDFCLGGDAREWAGLPVAELRPKIEVFAEALDQLGRLGPRATWPRASPRVRRGRTPPPRPSGACRPRPGGAPRASSFTTAHAALRDAGRQGRAEGGRGGGRRRATVPEDDLRRPCSE